MKAFEWKADFVVEGFLPKKLPVTIHHDCVLERFLEAKGEEGERRAILSVKINRQSVPSNEELEEVERIAIERAREFANLYSLIVDRLRILSQLSVGQVAPHKGMAYFSYSLPVVGLRFAFPPEEMSEKIKRLGEVKPLALKRYLSLALSHYSLALWTEPKSSYVNAMICVEALYNDSPQELRYRMAHRMANLLGVTERSRRRIFSEISDLYRKRSTLVHGLKQVDISKEIGLLMIYSKYSLMAFLKLGENKRSILQTIDEAIYKEETRKKTQEKIIDILRMLEQDLSKQRKLGKMHEVIRNV